MMSISCKDKYKTFLHWEILQPHILADAWILEYIDWFPLHRAKSAEPFSDGSNVLPILNSVSFYHE